MLPCYLAAIGMSRDDENGCEKRNIDRKLKLNGLTHLKYFWFLEAVVSAMTLNREVVRYSGFLSMSRGGCAGKF